ncbi:MAG: DNA alkylation repair protein, partial [Polyangiales bacterium]
MSSIRLKDFFGERVVRAIAADLRGVYAALDSTAFVTECLAGLEDLELLPRGQQIADVMRRHLPQPFAAAAHLLLAMFERPAADSGKLAGPLPESFRYLPHALFVQSYGTDDLELALQLQYELTQRFTAEFSIRPFLVRYPSETLARLRVWASDPSPHVRRLVSEGTRPRLPWAPRLRAFQADPRPVLALLELLRDDTALYVQRSVANNLNDIAKDHPELVVETCRRWAVGAPPERRWIIRHALRSLVKRGDRRALALLGAGGRPRVRIGALRMAPKAVRVGGALRFSLELSSTARRTQTLLVDYVVHFVKANGETRPKVFKLKQLVLAPGETCTLSGKVSFQPLTTRKPYPG